ncbi:hypothetical protein BHS09_27265 [Myxococcus xanthus]|uniref:Uncharacterized protein n=1 Tax=Myxococcus xanthus TaxID=34 RepID=A0AAE6G3U0_MYXXA|nr:hypothetical protein BHS09_27265 [Myxococcus xanthus]QDE77646.1 hypothetical protein BHS08_27285 [Myxococcus xanthus]
MKKAADRGIQVGERAHQRIRPAHVHHQDEWPRLHFHRLRRLGRGGGGGAELAYVRRQQLPYARAQNVAPALEQRGVLHQQLLQPERQEDVSEQREVLLLLGTRGLTPLRPQEGGVLLGGACARRAQEPTTQENGHVLVLQMPLQGMADI